jgi:predicted dehydrogenase
MKNPDGNGGRFGLDIYGGKGIIAIRFAGNVPVSWLKDPTWAPRSHDADWRPLPNAPESVTKDARKERNKPITDDLIAAIEENRLPAVSMQDGRRAQEMIQAVFESHVQGGRVKLPLEQRTHPLTRW